MKTVQLQKTFCEECKKEMIKCECNLIERDVSFLMPKIMKKKIKEVKSLLTQKP